VELAGVAGKGTLGLNVDANNLDLSLPEELARADISLTNEAFVNTSGNGGGSIQVQGANVTLSDRTFMFADTLGSENGGGIVVGASQLRLEGGSGITADVIGSGVGGDLTVNASESVQVIGVSSTGTPSFLGGRVIQGATGNAGDLSIITGQLLIKDGARVSAGTFGEGNGGNLTVNASESVQVIGESADGTRSGLFNQTLGKGDAGELTINTRHFQILAGAKVSTQTDSEGTAGNLTVNASESVTVSGLTTSGDFGSDLFSSSSRSATGDGGNLRECL
jgi:large exoprotein involved in heme utilization and adhesion